MFFPSPNNRIKPSVSKLFFNNSQIPKTKPVIFPMESMNLFKGYGKVNPDVEDQAPYQPKTTSNRSTITISAIILLTLTIALMLAGAALIHESNSEAPEEEDDSSTSLSSSSSADSIKAVCNVTNYPSSCFTSISSLNNIATKHDPEIIFNLSLHVSINELKNLSSLLISINDVGSQAAMKDCFDQFDDALTSLNDSLLAMEVGVGEKVLTLKKINNIQTWISAALTDQDTCVEGLQEMGSPVLAEVKSKMERSKEYLSNSLAIIAKMQTLLQKFDVKLH